VLAGSRSFSCGPGERDTIGQSHPADAPRSTWDRNCDSWSTANRTLGQPFAVDDRAAFQKTLTRSAPAMPVCRWGAWCWCWGQAN